MLERLRRATCCPAIVVVERNNRRRGYRALRSAASARAVSASPTDTAWIQIDSSASMLNEIGRNPSR